MQPLISVDHESRQNSYRTFDDNEDGVSEDTPLLHRFPQDVVRGRNQSTTLIVSLLLVILTSGVVIGIYLLVLQNNAEHVLPPVEIPLQLVSRTQWDYNDTAPPILSATAFKPRTVIIVQSDTRECLNTKSCVKLIREIQARWKKLSMYVPYNFLVSPNGQTYEALGWHRMSPLYPEYAATSLVLAFIGNYTEIPPTREQINEAKNFIVESVRHGYLESDYIVFGKRTHDRPRHLFKSMMNMPQWNNELTDK